MSPARAHGTTCGGCGCVFGGAGYCAWCGWKPQRISAGAWVLLWLTTWMEIGVAVEAMAEFKNSTGFLRSHFGG